jgi:diguanylate cyclase (GGDEF)-like protein
MSNANMSHRWIWRTPLGWTVIASTLGVLAYSVWVLFFQAPSEEEAILSSLGLIALGGLGTLLGLYLIHLSRDNRRLQAAWFLLTMGVAVSFVAECLWLYYDSILHIDPFPSIADIFYLLSYPLTLFGVLLLPFAPFERRERLTLFMDLAIVLSSAALVFWYFLVVPVQLSGVEMFAGLVAISYPIADLLLLGAVVALVQRDIQRVAWWTMFLFGWSFMANAAADTLYAYFENNGLAYSMSPLNILWMVSLLLLIYSFAIQIRSREAPLFQIPLRFKPARRLLQVMLPYAAAVSCVLLLFFLLNQAQDITLPLLGVLRGSLVLILLVLARQYIVLRQNLSLIEEMRIMASTDSLTRIYNRHFFNEIFHLKIQEAVRYNKPLSILLMDVDSFKQINDRYGHLKGDEVLREVARLLSTQLRSADLIARFGGDEFVAILPYTGLPRARKVARRLKHIVAAQNLDGVPLGISIGCAEFSPGQCPEELLENADKDLYAHKAEKTQIRYPGVPKGAYGGQTEALSN